MSDQFKELKCEKCDSFLQRLYTNEQLQKQYPVDMSNPFDLKNRENMKMWMNVKRLWKCEKCNEIIEISKFKLIRLSQKYGDLK